MHGAMTAATTGSRAHPAPSRQRGAGRCPFGAGLLIRTTAALALANARYWTSVAPHTRAQLRRWRARAETIEDTTLRALALRKLDQEGFNAEVAATLATLAPPPLRARAVEAIVALEVIYDYLDELTELAAVVPGRSRRLFLAFVQAVSIERPPERRRFESTYGGADGPYLWELATTVHCALRALPASAQLDGLLTGTAERAAEAQLHIHGAAHIGEAQLEQWARLHAAGTPLQWREYLAGAASSVLATHALIAAAARPHASVRQGLEIDRVYLTISVLPTILDSLVDYEEDAAAGRASYVERYDDAEALAERLGAVVAHAVEQARAMPDGGHHAMTLVGVVAYYFSAPSARNPLARTVAERMIAELQPLITPTLAIMRTWRAAKRAPGRGASKVKASA